MSKLEISTQNCKIKHPYKCVLCDKSQYKNANGIVRHVIKEHSEQYSIEEYFMKFIDEYSFKLIYNNKIAKSPLPIKWRLGNICAECRLPNCKFNSFGKGFSVFCTSLCAQKNKLINNARTVRAKKKLKEKHGVENPSQIAGVPDKVKETKLKNHGSVNYTNSEQTKKTNLQKYGVEYFTQTKQYKTAVRQTSIKKYGVEHFTQSEKVKNKTINTNIAKYGVQHTLQVPKIREKIINTNLKKYGVHSLLELKSVREKAKNKCQKKYGAPYYFQSKKFKNQHSYYTTLSNRHIVETGISVKEWLDAQKKPKPAYSTMKGYLANANISLSNLETYISSYRNKKTYIEHIISELFNSPHYNSTVVGLGKKYRPDFMLSDSVFLNTDGLYWHSEAQKDKWYHFNLRKDFENAGLRMFQFREDEISEKSKIIKSIINNALGLNDTKLFARKCKIKKVTQKDATIFLSANHLMGTIKAKHLGLFFQEELISLMSWKCKGNVCKIERFCSKINYSVVGGFSKLLNCLENNYLNNNIEEIHNWVDLRYGTGNHLSNKGFTLSKETLGWKWTNGRETYNRLKCRANMDDRHLTMKEHAQELGWIKIYDAGQRLWVKSLV